MIEMGNSYHRQRLFDVQPQRLLNEISLLHVNTLTSYLFKMILRRNRTNGFIKLASDVGVNVLTSSASKGSLPMRGKLNLANGTYRRQ